MYELKTYRRTELHQTERPVHQIEEQNRGVQHVPLFLIPHADLLRLRKARISLGEGTVRGVALVPGLGTRKNENDLLSTGFLSVMGSLYTRLRWWHPGVLGLIRLHARRQCEMLGTGSAPGL